jgi:hypothetical protein
MKNYFILCCNCNYSDSFTLFSNYGNEIVIGLFTSAIAGILAFAFNRLYLNVKTNILYKKITGKWLSYAFKNEYSFDRNNILGEIEINKIGNYTLHLKYSEKNSPHVWEGDIFMNKEFTKIGKICWRYIILHGQPTSSTTISGFKDFVIEKNNLYGITLRIIGERDKGYGDELLIKKLIN